MMRVGDTEIVYMVCLFLKNARLELYYTTRTNFLVEIIFCFIQAFSILIIWEFLTGNISTCLTIWSDKWHKLHWWLIPEPIYCLLNKLIKKVSSFFKVFYYLESDILIQMIYTDLIFFQSLGSCSRTNISIAFLLCFIIWTCI